MSATPPSAVHPTRGRVAFAVVHGEPPDVYIAENEAVLTRLLAVHVVAATDPHDLPTPIRDRIRRALLTERWADAVAEWIAATDRTVDAYPDEPIWTEHDLDLERTTLEMRVARIFHESDD